MFQNTFIHLLIERKYDHVPKNSTLPQAECVTQNLLRQGVMVHTVADDAHDF